MADKFITFLDLTKRSGNDAAVGLVEEVTTHAPELSVVRGRSIPGTSFKTKVRTALGKRAAGSGQLFRNANEGVDTTASTFAQKVSQCYFMDVQMQVDEALASGTGEGDSMGELLTDEANGAFQESSIELGSQFYDGTDDDDKGFPGLKAAAGTDLVVDALGTGSRSRVWFIWNDPKGVQFVFGNGQGLEVGEWERQQVTDANSKKFFAYVNNAKAWIGLSVQHSKSLGYIHSCNTAKPMTDALAAELMSKFPVGMKPNLCFMNRDAAFQLQKSRSATSITNSSAKAATGRDVFAPAPTETQGVPIVVTDSIVAADAD